MSVLDVSFFKSTQAIQTLNGIQRGLEKESLRVDNEGHLAQTPHPYYLGSALTHPLITTDYSEALLEFVTPTATSPEQAIESLNRIHQYVYQQLQQSDELLWATSMPCILGGDENIPIAYYGKSNIGKLKTLYRKGLGYRYGRLMQTISGIHYNFSLPDNFWQLYQQFNNDSGKLQSFKTTQYFSLIRNFRRYSWLLLYLFGASPAVCKSFLHNRQHTLKPMGQYSYYLPYATCLRMGNLGYTSQAQSMMDICYNSLNSYINTLKQAITTPYPKYEKIGQQNENGEFLQINCNLLQIENEFYSPIRPKRVTQSGEKPVHALQHRGVEYIEVRCLDVNPFLPVGIDEVTSRFIDAFLLFCLLKNSPSTETPECREILSNIDQVVIAGRDPKLTLSRNNQPISCQSWAEEILNEVGVVATILDKAHQQQAFIEAVDVQRKKLANPDLTPSGSMLKTMQNEQLSFYQFALHQSQQHQHMFITQTEDPLLTDQFKQLAEQSFVKQKDVETSDQLGFKEYLKQHNSQL